MKIARDHGNRGQLGAAVALVWEKIRKLHADAAFGYLAKIVRQRKDYTRLVAIQDQFEDKTRTPVQVLDRLNAKLPVFLDRAKGMVVTSRKGTVLGPVHRTSDGGGYLEFMDDRGIRVVVTVNARFITQWEEGDWLLRQPDAARRDLDGEFGTDRGRF